MTNTPTPGAAAELPPLPKSRACLWVTDNPRHCGLLRPAPNVVNAFPWPADSKSEKDRLYWREKGFWQEPLFTADQMHTYAQSQLDALREEVARLTKNLAACEELQRIDVRNYLECAAERDRLRAELAALKAQPTDVDEVMALADEWTTLERRYERGNASSEACDAAREALRAKLAARKEEL